MTCSCIWITEITFEIKKQRARVGELSPFPSLVSPRIFFSVNFSPALYYLNAWNRLTVGCLSTEYRSSRAFTERWSAVGRVSIDYRLNFGDVSGTNCSIINWQRKCTALKRSVKIKANVSKRNQRELFITSTTATADKTLHQEEFALLQNSSLLIFHLVQFVKCWQIVLELNSKRLHL